MQTMNGKKQSRKETSRVRTLTIQPKIRCNRRADNNITPEIRLCGNWLQSWGFSCGRKVTVSQVEEMLVIKLVSD